MRRNRKQQPPQPKAWQGPNPITQKASAVIPNGTEKPLPKPPSSQPQTKNTAESNADKHAHDRALYLIASFTVRIPETMCDVLQQCRANCAVMHGGCTHPRVFEASC